jgi:hypothetical protein
MRPALSTVAAACLLTSAGCMHASPPPLAGSSTAPSADSITVALWHLDERAGTRVIDSGPSRLEGTAGRATTSRYGRFGLCRSFQHSLDSFLFVPFDPALEQPTGLTIEAWIQPTALGRDEDTPLAARWTEDSSQQSWIFSLGGGGLLSPVNVDPSPGYHLAFFAVPAPGHLLFVYQPSGAGPPRVFVSTRAVELSRWTHVAVTFDGQEVRFFLDGLLDSQFASSGRIRASSAPLLVGNYFDPRTLTRFGGDLRPEIVGSTTSYYAYQGLIDELRISSESRRNFAPPTSR